MLYSEHTEMDMATAVIPADNAPVQASATDAIMADAYTQGERRFLREILATEATAEESIPLDIDGDKLWMGFWTSTKAIDDFRKAGARLKLIVGRILVVLEARPEIYRKHGYRSFDAFMSTCVPERLGISRGEAYHAKRLAKRFESLPMERASRIGFSKLAKIARVTGDDDPNRDKWLQFAEEHTLNEVKEAIGRAGAGIDKDDLEMDDLNLVLTRTCKEHLVEFLNNPLVSAYVGSDSISAKIDMMVAECEGCWIAVGGEQ